MESTNNQINALCHHLGSKEKVSSESGVSRGTLFNMQKQPHKILKSSSAILINNLYNERPTEWDGYANFKEILRSIDTNQVELSKSKYLVFLNDLKLSLLYHRAQGLDSVEGAGVDYCEAQLKYKHRFYLKLRDSPTVDSIDKSLESALTKLQKHAPENFTLSIAKIIITRYVIFFQSQNVSTRSSSEENKKRLIECKFIDTSKLILNKQPWNWGTARNGLVAASMLEDKKTCTFFWEALKKSHKTFRDPHFSPGSLPSIHDDPDLKWFRKNVLKKHMES